MGKQLTLKIRKLRTVKAEALEEAIATTIRQGLPMDVVPKAIVALLSTVPRATAHDADLFLNLLENSIPRGGLPMRDQLDWISLGQKLNPYLLVAGVHHAGEVTIEVSEKERQFIQARLNDKNHSMPPVTIVQAEFLLELVGALNLRVDGLEEGKED